MILISTSSSFLYFFFCLYLNLTYTFKYLGLHHVITPPDFAILALLLPRAHAHNPLQGHIINITYAMQVCPFCRILPFWCAELGDFAVLATT